jgi:hypothetical protein
MDKERLDELIEKYKAQPVGHGYIDIVVSRENYKSFIADLINGDYKIKSISWWEWCPEKKDSEYGLGGPTSRFYSAWFSELSIDVDDIELAENMKSENIIKELINRIETKSITFPNGIATFKQNSWLTPAVWLDVPDDWRNKYCA